MSYKTTPLKVVLTKTIDTTLADTPAIDIRSYVCGGLFVDANKASVTITYHASSTIDGTYLVINDAGGTAVTQTVAQPEAIAIPKEVFLFPFIKIISNADDGEDWTMCFSSVAVGE